MRLVGTNPKTVDRDSQVVSGLTPRLHESAQIPPEVKEVLAMFVP
jgi:hypothetical protein